MGTSNHFGKTVRRALVVCTLGVAGVAFALTAGCSHGMGSSASTSGNNSSGSGSGSGSGGGGTGPTITFNANPSSVAPGGTTTLTWSSVGAAGCTGSETDPSGTAQTDSTGFIGTQPPSGTFTTAPLNSTGAYTFTLTCIATNGSQTIDNLSVPVTASTSSTPPVVNFAANPSAVAPGGATQLTWTTTGAQSCTGSETDSTGNPVSGNGAFSGTQVTNGNFNSLPLNTAGSYRFTLACTASGGSQTVNSLTILVSSPPPTITFNANPSSVAPGGTTTLTWSSVGAASCTGSEADPSGTALTGAGAFTGTQPISDAAGFATQTLNSTGTYVFTLTCLSASGGKTVANLPVPVATPGAVTAPTITFSANPPDIAPGDTTTLTWSSVGAASCTGSETDPSGTALTGAGAFTGTQPINDAAGFTTQALNSAGNYIFTLTCLSASGGKTVNQLAVPVTAPGVAVAPTVSFSANPSNVAPGGTTTLTWTTTGAASCTGSETDPSGTALTGAGAFTGTQPVNDATGFTTQALNSAGNYIFTLTCLSSSGGKTVNQLAVPVAAPTTQTITLLNANPAAVAAGSSPGTSVLTWNHPEAASCTASSTDPNGAALTGAGAFTGTQAVTNGSFTTLAQTLVGTYTYTLACVTSAGATETPDKATVTVYIANTDVALSASPNNVPVGGTSTLTWNHPDASGCTASETDPSGTALTGATDFNGNEPTNNGVFTTAALNANPPGTYTFSLACTDKTTGKVTTDTATVTTYTPVVTGDNCDVGTTSTALTNATALDTTFTAASGTTGLCIGCTVANPGNAINPANSATVPYYTDYATINTLVGLLLGPTENLTVANTSTSAIAPFYSGTSYPAGQLAGFVINVPNQLLGAGVLQTVTVSTLLRNAGGVEQPTGDTATYTGTAGGALKLKVLGLTGGGTEQYVALLATKPFDAVELSLSGLVNLNNQLDVYYGCVADNP